MFTTKKDVDQHVRSALVKIKSENEKKLRGFTIAKLYYKINEFEIARHYISNYLSIKEDCAPAYKLLGQCYQQLKKPQKALESFQRSLQLDSKQPDLLIEVCKLLLSPENNVNMNKAKYWCDLAESEKIQHDAVFSLRLKLLNQDNMENKQVEELIMKEIKARPYDPNLKIRLLKYYIEQNKILDAFKYAYEQEIKSHDLFSNSSGWYNIVWLALNKYKHQSNSNKSWEFWLLLIICLERQIEMSFSIMNGSITETKNLLFTFDQYLFEASQIVHSLFPEKEFTGRFLNHFKGQLCLHAASLIFKREQIQNKNQWKDSTKNALPLLLLAFQCGTPDIQESWLKHCDDKIKQIIQLWNREGAFRCSQSGRTLLSCIDNSDSKENSSISSQVHQLLTNKNFWTNSDELLSQVRSFCSDINWRNKIFRILFADSDQIRKMSTSFLINSKDLIEPNYELPSYADVESYEEIAQYLKPQSLQHMVYLCLGLDNLSDVRCKYFSGLNFSTQNLNFCGSESLNQLDIETFLYATVIQAKRLLEIERIHNENYNSVKIGKPIILPYVNMTGNLCTEEQSNWWQCAYKLYRNLINGESLSEIRTTLQYGIEAVRGVSGPKMDLMIVLKLGKIFMDRSQDVTKSAEKNYLEQRTEMLFKHALNIYKLHNKGVLEPFRKLFKYSNSNSSSVENEIKELAEDAVIFLAGRYFKNSDYEECIEEFSGIQLPFATYFQAEAYKKLDESNKTPRKTKKLYLEKARDCLNQTVNLLNYPNTNTNHPLNSIVNSEIKRLQFIHQISSENLNNSHFSISNIDNPSINREFDNENSIYYGRSGGINDGGSIIRRESLSSVAAPKLFELENLVKQIATTLTFVKDELVDMIKPEVKDTRRELTEFKSGIKTDFHEFKIELNEFKGGIKTELNELRDKLSLIEENMKKKSQTPSRDDASNVLEELYFADDPVYSNQNNLYSGYSQPVVSQQPPQPLQRLHTPNALSNSHHPTIVTPSPHHVQSTAGAWYSPEYFTAQCLPFNVPAVDRQQTFNPRFPFPDAANTPINFNMSMHAHAPQQTIVNPLQQLENRTNAFSMINQQQQYHQQQQQQPTSIPSSKILTQPITVSTMKSNSPAFWNRVPNNAPVEKGPPVNVVITNSDPLPTTNVSVFAQPTLSVTIPPQHIKSNFMPNDTIISSGSSTLPLQQQIFSNINFPTMVTQSFSTTPQSIPTPVTSNQTLSLSSLISNASISNEINGFSMKEPSSSSLSLETGTPSTVLNLNNSTENNEDDKSLENNAEYDPRPDFKPIIPLPDEVEVKTGEEDENVLFCARAKLFRHIDKEWKERGIGNIKILKNKNDGRIRILMRRDQTHKICANHYITYEMNLLAYKNDEKSYIWAAKDYADEEERSETLCIRFKQAEIAKEFYDVFNKAKNEMKDSNLNRTDDPKNVSEKIINNMKSSTATTAVTTTTTSATTQSVTGNALNKSSIFNFNTLSQQKNDNENNSAAINSFNTTKSIFTIPSGGVEGVIQMNQQQKTVGDDKQKLSAGQDDANKTKSSPFASFTFSTPVVSNNAIDTSNPFAKFSFGSANQAATTTTTTAINLFPSATSVITSTVAATAAATTTTTVTSSKVNTSTANNVGEVEGDGNNDDFVPTAEFKPVIPLPDLVEVQTGEENEIVLFEHRAKLYRYDKQNAQWKERGVGNIKLLVEKENSNRLRLLMRREQVLKVCINLRLTKTMQFKAPANNILSSLHFGGKDYSEDSEGKIEFFAIRFKTEEICKSFHEAVVKAQANMSTDEGNENKTSAKNQEESNTVKELSTNTQNKEFGLSDKNKNQQQQQQEKGFGDQFKPKPGSWSCKDCYTSNGADILYCIACEAPKDDTVPKKSTSIFAGDKSKTNESTPKFSFGFNTKETPKPDTTTTETKNIGSDISFGDQFKPKPGSWSCNACYISNGADSLYCVACESPKDDTVPKKSTNLFAGDKSKANENTPKFSFGFNTKETSITGTALTTTTNGGSDIGFGTKTTTSSFTFGFQNNDNKQFETKAVDLTQQPQQPFNFNIGFSSDKNTAEGDKQKTNIFSFEPKQISTTATAVNNNDISSSTSTSSSLATTGIFNTFSFSTMSSSASVFPTFDNKTSTAVSSSLPSKPLFSFGHATPSTTVGQPLISSSNEDNNEFKLEKKEFSFVLKPKSPGKSKSPLKSNISGCDDESDNENVEEENNAYFTPVIPLPEKIEVKTGEEDEDMLYCHRAKLFRFTNSEWKERGLGDVKILRHKQTKKLRVVMRREQILKICLNHVLTDDIEYMRKDDKSWHFVVKDFSEGELELTQFCIRFKTKEIAGEFMDAVKNALSGNDDKIMKSKATVPATSTLLNDSEKEESKNDRKDNKSINADDQITMDRKLAMKLKLPFNYFEMTNYHEDCIGCRGCDPEKFIFPEYRDENKDDEQPLPLDMSGLNFTKKQNISGIGNSSILKESSFSLGQQKDNLELQKLNESINDNNEKKSIFDNSSFSSATAKSTNVFSLGDNINFGSPFTFKSTGDQKSIFGGSSVKISDTSTTPTTLFGSVLLNKPPLASTTESNSVPQQQQQQQKSGFTFNKAMNSENLLPQFTFGSKSFETGKLFGTNLTNSNPVVPSVTVSNTTIPITATSSLSTSTPTTTLSSTTNKDEKLTPTNIFKDPGISFSDLASMSSSNFKVADNSQENPSSTTGFIGLTQNDAFRNFSNPQFQKINDKTSSPSNNKTDGEEATNDTNNDDSNYDPHYDPIIELPNEIKVVTGEENEEKIFGERATLFRYDSETKQWKERGVGELKILYHPINETYRLILRREQIHKLVLNHLIPDDFSMKPMNNTGKSFCWMAQNYAEEPGWEKLACRFKHVETGQKFENEINKCIKQLKKRSGLAPEED